MTYFASLSLKKREKSEAVNSSHSRSEPGLERTGGTLFANFSDSVSEVNKTTAYTSKASISRSETAYFGEEGFTLERKV